ncbi:MAG: sigma-70 family RNA polymerase sigma factor [Candidatus Acidiferrales bacterium]
MKRFWFSGNSEAMSALQHLASSQTMAGPPFAIKKSPARKPTHLGPPPSTGERPGPAASAEDLELIQRAVAGESEAQTRLFATHTPMLYRVALRVLRNKEDAEDAVQDTWHRAYARLDTFEGRSSISTWLTRISINSALMIRRKNKRRFEVSLQETPDDEGSPPHAVDNAPTPEESCRHTELRHLLAQQIHRLPSLIRTAFLLRHVNGFSTAESLQRLGINSSALKSRVQRARRKLAQNMLPLLSEDQLRNSLLSIGFDSEHESSGGG